MKNIKTTRYMDIYDIKLDQVIRRFDISIFFY
jgi:hypothetical protein